jgi:hypothetical protein
LRRLLDENAILDLMARFDDAIIRRDTEMFRTLSFSILKPDRSIFPLFPIKPSVVYTMRPEKYSDFAVGKKRKGAKI